MTPKKSSKRTDSKVRYLQIRLDQATYETIETVTKRFSLKKSEMVREAIARYLLTLNNPDTPNPKMIVTQNQFRTLIAAASPELLKKLSFLTFSNAIEEKSYFDNGYDGDIPRHLISDDFEGFMRMLVENYLRKDMEHWFEEIEYFKKGPNFYLKGTHHLGLNYTEFFKNFLEHLANWGNYELIRETTNETTSKIKMKGQKDRIIKEYALTLVFSPKKKNK